MKILKKMVKWGSRAIALLLALVLLAGLLYRLGTPAPKPPGELVDVGGFKLHINPAGEKSKRPTVVIETGQALPSEHYHWLSEGLKDSLRVVRYDRAGIAYSDLSRTPRDPKNIARELHTLLERAGESPPYIMVGHSFGGLFIRVFAQQYPDEVAGLVFIDSSHPDQRQRLQLPKQPDPSLLLNTAAFLADIGVLGIFDRLNGSILYVEDFPAEVNDRFYDYTLNGKYYRGYRNEIQWETSVYDQARETTNFGDLPLRVFTAGKKYSGTPVRPEWIQLQREISELSSNGRHIVIDGHHNSIYSTRENADVICGEIIKLAGGNPAR
ncbi:alpha/beta fold hydrolase [Lewinella sp. W8]|uniref:alpha/beta fold hydrolase n=1 Tax=Lewinella sp. W8 TaxID=2528208 RepID=UPI0010687120|nr:alpha/beta hydrolase [Lewinella sp. W8]MTB51508.1 alpha/beta fold hydrolase [Lewinella sp. W8]